MANISSYNQLSSWNEDDDLLFVQQPDAPKKAHPSQMKEYILRGLDVSSVGGTGKYISAISETDGKISATAETMDVTPTEDSTKAVTSGGIKTAIDDSVSLKTATGNPITLTDAANANSEKLLMTIEPIQSGSGDPSPTNVRPISGISTASVQTTDGTNTNTATITLGQTVYGGSVNFKTGEVTVTHGMVDLGTLTWTFRGTIDTPYFYASTSQFPVGNIKYSGEYAQTVYPMLCTIFKTVSRSALTVQANTNIICVDGGGDMPSQIQVRDTAYTDASAFKTAMSGVQLCYELATPTILTLTPAELELLKGNNTVSGNGAEISIEYYPDNAIGALAERVDGKADITYVDNAVNAIKYLTTSTTSFADAGARAGIQYGADFADIVNTRINDLSTGIFMLETSGPKLGVVLFKYTNVYYSGIILNYFAMNERKPLYFVYQDGTYGIRIL